MTETVRLADYVFDLLAAAGVSEVFLLPGGGAMHLVDAAGRHPAIQYLPQHHEQACGIAAEANGRVNENIGVAVVTTGPGATNALTPVAGAWIESTPLLVISGQVKRPDLLNGRALRQSGVQEVDVVSMVRPVTKYAVIVDDPSRIRYHVEKALYLARHGRKGPVWLDIPLDVQGAPIDPAQQQGFDPAELPPLATASAAVADSFVAELWAALQAAQRPLLLLGHGVRLSGAAARILPLLEALAVPVVTTWNALDLLPHEHALCVGRPGSVAVRAPNFAVQNCDLLLAIGARLDNIVTAYNPAAFAGHARKFVVDIDANELLRHGLPDGQTLALDAAEFIGRLSARAQAQPLAAPADWIATCQDWKQRFGICDGQPFPNRGVISHFHVVEALSEALPEGGLIVTGSSGLAVEAFYTGFRNKPGQRLFLTSGLGAMGYGLPAAIGACLANGGKKTFLVESDGSLQLNLQELATLRGVNLPIVVFLLNNHGYTSIRNTQRNYFASRFVGTGAEAKLFLPDIVALAAVYGIAGARINSVEELAAGLAAAVAAPGPYICDISLIADEVLWPRVSSQPQADGSMVTLPLEDMTPLLSLADLQREMRVPLNPASLKARGHG